MTERLFAKSSYSGGNGGVCLEASAPEGYRLKGLVDRCGDMACRTVSVPDGLTFGKTGYSNAEGNCVEVGGAESLVFVRDSKIEDSPLVGASPEAFMAFTEFAARQAVELDA